MTETAAARSWFETGALSFAVAFLIMAVGATVLAIRVAGDGDQIFEDWVAALEEQETYRFSMRQDITSPGGTPGMNDLFSFEGEVDVQRGLSRSVTTINMLGTKATCTHIAKGNDVLYASVHPSRRAQLGASWLKSDVTTVLTGTTFAFRPDQFQKDPGSFFRDLSADGSEEIRGVDTTRYRGTFDLLSLYSDSATPPPLPSEARRGIPVALYVGEDGLPRRLTFELSSSESVSVSSIMEFYDYGDPLEITEPPAEDVKDGEPQQIGTACFPADGSGG